MLRRLALVSILAGMAIVGFASPAAAESAVAGLGLTVRADDPTAPVVVLTNNAASSCLVASTAVGTVSATRVEQGGTAVEPIVYDAAFSDDLGAFLVAGLRELEPGESIELPLRMAPVGPTGHALDIVNWSARARALGTLYPVEPGRPLILEVTYALPVQPESDRPVCVLGAAGVPAAGSGTATDSLRWIVIGGGAAALALVIVIVIAVVRRRGRPRGGKTVGAAAAILLLSSGVVLADGWNQSAQAEISVAPALADAWAECSAILHGPGGDPAGILPTLEGSGVNVQILVAAPGSQTGEGAISPTQIFLYWNLNDRHAYAGTGGNADPCTSLYHEMYHAWEDANGGQNHGPCVTSSGDSGLPVNEVNATRAQNLLRAALGLPERSHYGKIPLPEGECLPPEEQPREPECAPNCGDSNGDPHLTTFDGLRYDFQAVGEFVAVRDSAGDLQVQVRQSPVDGSRLVAVNRAVALDVAGDRVQLTAARTGLELLLNGENRPLEDVSLPAGGSIDISSGRRGTTVTVAWPDGSRAIVSPIGSFGLHLTVGLNPSRAGRVDGILGNFNGDPSDDIRLNGAPVEPTFDNLYPSFADSWRVDDASSLFTYEPGTSAATFTDKSFPERAVTAENLPNRAAAEAICRRLGITESVALAACTIDVGLTGQLDFAVAMASTQERIGSYGLNGTEAALTVSEPGGEASLNFTGTAGQIIFVEAPVTTLPTMCSPLELRAPDGSTLSTACLIDGRGHIDRTVLPEDGEYTLVLRPRAETGTVWVRVITATDQVGTIEPGADIVSTVAQPGAQSRFTFTATAGQVVFLNVPTSTLVGQCSPLRLLAPDGRTLGTGCIISNRGFVDRVVLPESGQYTVVVDPVGNSTGTSRLRLSFATDQIGAITLDGPAVTATIAQPGAVARFTFTATAGQTIRLDAVDSTLPSQCSPLRLLAPDGSTLSTGCVINGAGSIGPKTLPETGEYAIVVDPSAADLGQTTLALRSA